MQKRAELLGWQHRRGAATEKDGAELHILYLRMARQELYMGENCLGKEGKIALLRRAGVKAAVGAFAQAEGDVQVESGLPMVSRQRRCRRLAGYL